MLHTQHESAVQLVLPAIGKCEATTGNTPIWRLHAISTYGWIKYSSLMLTFVLRNGGNHPHSFHQDREL
jgi:hypothetical protein